MKSKNVSQKIICLNRKASFNYYFKELYEAGIVLKGSEIKSLRIGKGSIADSYAVDIGGEIFLINSIISRKIFLIGVSLVIFSKTSKSFFGSLFFKLIKIS